MVESAIATPRSSFEAPSRSPPSLLTIPPELHLRIYEYAFANVVSRRIHLRRYPKHEWHLRHPNPPRFPELLLVCRRIYHEGQDILRLNCTPPTIVISHAGRPWAEPPSHPKTSEPYGLRVVHDAVAPVLRSVQHLKLDAEVSAYFEEQALTIAMLKWMHILWDGLTCGLCTTSTSKVSLQDSQPSSTQITMHSLVRRRRWKRTPKF